MRRALLGVAALGVVAVPAIAQSPPPIVSAQGVTVTAFTPDYQRPFIAGGGELRSGDRRASASASVAVYAAPPGSPTGRIQGSKRVVLPRNGSNASVRVLVPCQAYGRGRPWSWFTVVTSRNTLRGVSVSVKATSGGRLTRCRPV